MAEETQHACDIHVQFSRITVGPDGVPINEGTRSEAALRPMLNEDGTPMFGENRELYHPAEEVPPPNNNGSPSQVDPTTDPQNPPMVGEALIEYDSARYLQSTD